MDDNGKLYQAGWFQFLYCQFPLPMKQSACDVYNAYLAVDMTWKGLLDVQ
jgi:hypothetical protein